MLGAVECGLGLASGGHVGLLVVEHGEHVLELVGDGKSGVSEHEEPAEQADESVSQLELDAEDLTDLEEGKRVQRLPNSSSWRQSSSDSHQESHCWSGLWAGC